jgi:hypothetical protein
MSREHKANIQAQRQQIRYIHRRNKLVLSDPYSKNADHTERSTDSDTHTLSDDTATQITSSHNTPPNATITMANPTQKVPLTFPFYSGDPDDDKADKSGIWHCRFELLWEPNTTDLEKITTFKLVLEPDSIAEEWWSNLDAGRKMIWADVKTEFKTEWPMMPTLEVSTEVRQETLMSLKVMEEEVGKIVADGKRKEYTHVIWADKAEAIWRLLEDHKGLLIHDVHKNLTEGILDCIPDTKATREDYKAFLQAVRDISTKKAVRHTKANQRVRSIEEQLSKLIQHPQVPPSPMSNLAN